MKNILKDLVFVLYFLFRALVSMQFDYFAARAKKSMCLFWPNITENDVELLKLSVTVKLRSNTFDLWSISV